MKKLHFAFCAVLTTLTVDAADRSPRNVEIIRVPSGTLLFSQGTTSQRSSDFSTSSDRQVGSDFRSNAGATGSETIVVTSPGTDFGGRRSVLIGPVFPTPIVTATGGQPTGFAIPGTVGGPGAVTPPLIENAVAPGFPTGPAPVGAPQVPGSSVPLPSANVPLAPPIAPGAPAPNALPAPQNPAGPFQGTAGTIQSTAGGIQTTVPAAVPSTVPGAIQNGVIIPGTVPVAPSAPVGAAQAIPGQAPAPGNRAQDNRVPIGPGAGLPANTGGTGTGGGTTGGAGTR
jgi:hypothetical protein